jgi:2-polyprenyl-6-methoxyphenol hydroxylase-like FAD-dependent oxidoreductase
MRTSQRVCTTSRKFLTLVRKSVPVTLLEEHPTFNRDFRGDTIHAGLLEILDEIGLPDRLHERQLIKMPARHSRASAIQRCSSTFVVSSSTFRFDPAMRKQRPQDDASTKCGGQPMHVMKWNETRG